MPELRKDPVVGRWVIIATERARRPSDFVTEPVRPRASACAFCEGHEQQTPPEILAGRPPDGRPIIPIMVAEELAGSAQYFDLKERCVWCDMIRQERRGRGRLVLESPDFVALAPFAPRFPFETWILPVHHRAAFEESTEEELRGVAETLGEILRRMNQVLGEPPYNFMLHTAPFREAQLESFHWHLEVIPKLTRVAGFEWGSGFFINPVPPEDAADALRAGTSRS